MSRSPQCSPAPAAAFLAAPLWAVQALIWTAGPKVQEQAPPYRITETALFELFWWSMAAAVASSAVAALAVPTHLRLRPTPVVRTAAVLARVAVASAGVAALSAAVAPVRQLQPAALTVMTGALYAAIVLLAVSLTLWAGPGWTSVGEADSAVLLPSALAALTVATIVAVLAGGTASTAGLWSAVLVVLLDGAAWLAWGNALASARRHRAAAHA
ncbi:hypothetical protein [Modestobacter sp. URMC 112]